MLFVPEGTCADESSSMLDVLDGRANGESAVIVKYICIIEDWSDYTCIKVFEFMFDTIECSKF